MIRINDHIFRADLIRHVWIETNGTLYYLFVEIDDDKSGVAYRVAMLDRMTAEHALEEVMAQLEKFLGWDESFT